MGSPVFPDRTERCLARAIELLEAADDIDKLYGEQSEQLIERTKETVLDVVKDRLCAPPGVQLAKGRATCGDITTLIGMNSFKRAHDAITREALLGLIDCVEILDKPETEVFCIDRDSNVCRPCEAKQEKRRDNESLSKGGQYE